MKPVIAIIGRPNVGKSTLFNRILGRRQAIVEDSPGVTRDRNYAETDHTGHAFIVVDTGGFDPGSEDAMLAIMAQQVEIALAEADALVLVVDARQGLTGADQRIWEQIRRSGRRVYLAVNKVDTAAMDPHAAEFWALGPDEIFPMTAERGTGVAELLDRVLADLQAPALDEVADDEGKGPARIAVLGRPNVGKSTLLNSLLGHPRYLTSEVPGTTRDSVDTALTVGDRQYMLVDTAGIRRRKKVEVGLERMSVARTLQALDRCHIAALVVDAVEGITDQDKKLAALIEDRGRGLILVVNKWDLFKGRENGDVFMKKIKDDIPFLTYLPTVLVSALSGRGVHRFLPTVDKVFENLFRRIPTHELNLFYKDVIQRHPPHVSGTASVKIKYLTQVQVNPPTVLMFRGGHGRIPESYLRFLAKEFRARWDFVGAPLKLVPK
jgi:GTP-binding protein